MTWHTRMPCSLDIKSMHLYEDSRTSCNSLWLCHSGFSSRLQLIACTWALHLNKLIICRKFLHGYKFTSSTLLADCHSYTLFKASGQIKSFLLPMHKTYYGYVLVCTLGQESSWLLLLLLWLILSYDLNKHRFQAKLGVRLLGSVSDEL